MSADGDDRHDRDAQDDAPGGAGGEQLRRRLLELLATDGPDTAESHGDWGTPGGDVDRARLGRICTFSVSEAGVSGAGVTVMADLAAGRAGQRDQVCATGARTRPLEDLQLTTGEGPCLDAYAAGAPVLVAELATETARWPGYGPEALQAGTAAVFSLPLQVGAVRLGTLDLNRDTVGSLSPSQFAGAMVLAGLATETLLELTGDPEAPAATATTATAGAAAAVGAGSGAGGDSGNRSAENPGWLPDVHAEVHQASGMVSARASIGVGDALLRIRAYAFAHSEAITEVARRIVARELVLDGDDP